MPRVSNGPTSGVFYNGDNLVVLAKRIDAESVDLVYLDPPFNSKQQYNVIYKDTLAQEAAFKDYWSWEVDAARTYEKIIRGDTATPTNVVELLKALKEYLQQDDMMAYLTMMTPRLSELRRVLKPTGSIFVHCDSTAVHYLKLILDGIFTGERFLNDIAWKRTTAHNDPKRFGRIQDRILYYSKGKSRTFNVVRGQHSPEQLRRYKYKDAHGHFKAENLTAPHFSETRTFKWRGTHPGADRQWRFGPEELERLYANGRILLKANGEPRKDGLKEYLEEAELPPVQDIWLDVAMAPTAAERTGYPTQKPLALLRRIIEAGSNPGDLVLDPFCGCGTTVLAASELGRDWIGIDISHKAVEVLEKRIAKHHPGLAYQLSIIPPDLAAAKKLAERDRQDKTNEFQWWVNSVIRAHAPGESTYRGKAGADGGIDGEIKYREHGRNRVKRMLVSVKSGGTSVKDIRDLRGTMAREKVEHGVFVTLNDPTEPMRQEALKAGFASPHKPGAEPIAHIQIIKVAVLFDDRRADRLIDVPGEIIQPGSMRPPPRQLSLGASRRIPAVPPAPALPREVAEAGSRRKHKERPDLVSARRAERPAVAEEPIVPATEAKRPGRRR